MKHQEIRITREELERFCSAVFSKLGLSQADAQTAARVLVAADVRGIPSHGVARLRRYVNGLQTGLMRADAEPRVVAESPASIVVDAGGAMGAPVSVQTMQRVIAKAREAGSAFGTVRDSNHFGIAGYYAMLALAEDMIGIAMSNTAALGVPTFGRQVMFGTNPLAFAAPADRHRAFVLDMSTTAVPRGKVEVYARKSEEMPAGWAVDRDGRPTTDAASLLQDMFKRVGGGLLPLGGVGEEHGGHKGYGLAVMVDVLCALLSGGPFGTAVFDTAESSARVSHFFGAIRIDRFRDPGEFRRDMDRMLEQLSQCPPAAGQERVFFAGQKEFEHEAECVRTGVPLMADTYAELEKIGCELRVARV